MQWGIRRRGHGMRIRIIALAAVLGVLVLCARDITRAFTNPVDEAGLNAKLYGPVTGAMLIGAAFFAVTGVIAHLVLNSERISEFLIDTDTEMNKVTWTTPKELKNATVVVLVTIAVLALAMAGADVLFEATFGEYVLKGLFQLY